MEINDIIQLLIYRATEYSKAAEINIQNGLRIEAEADLRISKELADIAKLLNDEMLKETKKDAKYYS